MYIYPAHRPSLIQAFEISNNFLVTTFDAAIIITEVLIIKFHSLNKLIGYAIQLIINLIFHSKLSIIEKILTS